MEIYKSSNKIDKTGFIWLIGSTVIGGVAIGAITYAVSLFFYLVIIFPLIMGGVGSAILSFAIQRGKVRNPLVAGFFGALMGLVISGSIQLAGYIQFRQSAVTAIKIEVDQQGFQADANKLEDLVDVFLEDQTGDRGFWGYVKYKARQGVSISRFGEKSGNLGEVGTWIYWIVEIIVIQSVIVSSVYGTASRPFSESSNQWYSEPQMIGQIRQSNNLLDLLQNNRFVEAGKLFNPLEVILNYPYMQIFIQTCPGDTKLILGVSTISCNKEGKPVTKTNLEGIITQGDYEKFQQGISESLFQLRKTLTDQQIADAIKERKPPFTTADKFESHGLDIALESNLVKQIAQVKQVKEAYLVRKTLHFFPERPLHILGIIRFKSVAGPEEPESVLIETLQNRLELPHQTQILILNENKEFLETMIKVQPEPFFKA